MKIHPEYKIYTFLHEKMLFLNFLKNVIFSSSVHFARISELEDSIFMNFFALNIASERHFLGFPRRKFRLEKLCKLYTSSQRLTFFWLKKWSFFDILKTVFPLLLIFFPPFKKWKYILTLYYLLPLKRNKN